MAVLLASGPLQPSLLIYLAVPPIVAGVRHGWVTTVNAGFVAGVTTLATLAVMPGAGDVRRPRPGVDPVAGHRDGRRTARQLAVPVDAGRRGASERRSPRPTSSSRSCTPSPAAARSVSTACSWPPSWRPPCARRPGATRSAVFIHGRRSEPDLLSSYGEPTSRRPRPAVRTTRPARADRLAARRRPAPGVRRAGARRRMDRRPADACPGGRRRVRAPPGHRGPLRRRTPHGDGRGAQPDRPRDARRCRPGDRRPRLHRRRDRVGLRPARDTGAGGLPARRRSAAW